MTVKEFMQSLESYPAMINKRGESITDAMQRATHIWTNDACSGYTVAAMQAAGFTEVEIWKVQRALLSVYDEMTIGEAEQAFKDWNNDFSRPLEG